MIHFDYYGAELDAFGKEIERIEREASTVYSRRNEPDFNLTHESLRYRVRANFVAASLVALVEYRLCDLARELCANFKPLKAGNFEGLLRCLTSPTDHTTGAALPRGRDVSQLPSWSVFLALREIRHPIVHGFGDNTLATREADARKAIEALQLKEILATDPRISFTPKALRVALDVARAVMNEIDAQDVSA